MSKLSRGRSAGLCVGLSSALCKNRPPNDLLCVEWDVKPYTLTRPKSTPSRGTIPKPHYVPHPWTRPTYDAKRHPDLIRRFSTMHWTDRRTDRQIVHGEV